MLRDTYIAYSQMKQFAVLTSYEGDNGGFNKKKFFG